MLSERLNALAASDFVIKYAPFGAKKNQVHYRLTDPFCLFFLHFVKDAPLQNRAFWQQGAAAQPISSWRGFAFENVCFSHIPQIKNALGISGVVTSESAWFMKEGDGEGIQIDLLITRNDNIVDICEIKYHSKEFAVTKGYYHTLLRRQELVLEHVPPTMASRNVLITTFGLSRNEYVGIFSHVVTMEDLFAR